MAVKLDEMKNFLRVDFDDDDKLIERLLEDGTKRAMDILRIPENDRATINTDSISNFDLAVMFAVAFIYEHREDADYSKLNLLLRSFLFGDREDKF